MNVLPISQVQFSHRKTVGFNPVTWTGYGAVGFGIASAIAGSRKKIKLHKGFAYVTGALALMHLGIVEYNKYKYKKTVV